MLTILAVPKPFTGHIGIIQRNAIQSWAHLHPDCEIILCGDETGTEEAAIEFKAQHIPNVERNEFGTPLLDSVFYQAERAAGHCLMCYVNADIILLSDFAEAVKRVKKFRRFLMVGQRWNLDVAEPIDFGLPDWEERLREHVIDFGVLHPPFGSDYFVFPRNEAVARLLPFAVGRPGWDNWVIYKALRHRIPVVDSTGFATVIHQNHDYSHVPCGSGETYEGPEAGRNLSLMGSPEYWFTSQDASYLLTHEGLRRRKWTRERFRRLKRTLPVLHPHLHVIVSLGQVCWWRLFGAFTNKHQRTDA